MKKNHSIVFNTTQDYKFKYKTGIFWIVLKINDLKTSKLNLVHNTPFLFIINSRIKNYHCIDKKTSLFF